MPASTLVPKQMERTILLTHREKTTVRHPGARPFSSEPATSYEDDAAEHKSRRMRQHFPLLEHA